MGAAGITLVLAASPLRAEDSAPCRAGLDEYAIGNYASAQAFLFTCVESHQGSPAHAVYLAQTFRSLRNYDGGLSRIEAALRQSPDDVDLLYLASWLQYRRNNVRNSMVLLSRAYRFSPRDWRLHQLFALNYITFDMLDTARLSFLQAIALNPRNAELYYQLGRLYYTQNRFEDSIGAMKSALSLAADYAEVFDSLGLTYEALGDNAQAAASFERAIEIGRRRRSRDEWPLIDYGAFLIKRESAQESLSLLNQALEFNPTSKEANYQMGRALRAVGRPDEAKKYLERAIQLDPSFSSAYYQLATLMRDLGDRDRFRVLIAQFKRLTEEEKTSGKRGNSVP